MICGIVSFPGSNCIEDTIYCFENVLGLKTKILWHQDKDIKNSDLIIIPGGFSYGDYVRAGAIANLSPIMQSIKHFADASGVVIGICNGFQILLEAKLLPGTLLKNQSDMFVSKNIYVKIINKDSYMTKYFDRDVLKLPIAHKEGRYYVDDDTLTDMVKNDQILFQYSDDSGDVNELFNPNGSINNIAGITNNSKNVYGFMPHLERACVSKINNIAGLELLKNLITNLCT